MRRKIFQSILCLFLIILTGCQVDPGQADYAKRANPPEIPITSAAAAPSNGPEPSHILLFIGDGMGSSHRRAAAWVKTGMDGKLAMDTLPVSGWSQTASADEDITDSAAAGTAIATGRKTNNGMLAIDPSGSSLKTILEYARESGMAVGLVTNVPITHATPASFAAHVTSRYQITEIAEQLLDQRVNVLFGGGENEFLPKNETGCYPEFPGYRLDNRNLIVEAQNTGYTYICNAAEFHELDPAETAFALGLFADKGMERPFTPSLSEMTRKSIDILKNDPQGFFLMVEGGQIDWASHENDAANAIQDTIDFDEAVQVGIDFANTQSNTLIIVTADHETGGMTLHLEPDGTASMDGPFYTPDGSEFFVSWQTGGHTSADVPVSSSGPGADLLTGTFQNTRQFWSMANLILDQIYMPIISR